MERSLFGFIIRYSKRDQLLIVPLVLASMVVYYLSLDLPKTIINQAIQGVGFPHSAPPPPKKSTVCFFASPLVRGWVVVSPPPLALPKTIINQAIQGVGF